MWLCVCAISIYTHNVAVLSNNKNLFKKNTQHFGFLLLLIILTFLMLIMRSQIFHMFSLLCSILSELAQLFFSTTDHAQYRLSRSNFSLLKEVEKNWIHFHQKWHVYTSNLMRTFPLLSAGIWLPTATENRENILPFFICLTAEGSKHRMAIEPNNPLEFFIAIFLICWSMIE